MPKTEEILKLTISSFFYDDELAEIFVLKGGNALSLGHGISNRSSLDIDLSMDKPFALAT